MNKLNVLLTAGFLNLFAPVAFAADGVFVSCYSATSNLLLSFDQDQKMFTYTRSSGALVDAFDSSPSGHWENISSVSIQGVGSNSAHLKAQIVTGDAEAPIINTSVEIQVTRQLDGGFILTSASLYHLSQAYDLSEFVGQHCYVQ